MESLLEVFGNTWRPRRRISNPFLVFLPGPPSLCKPILTCCGGVWIRQWLHPDFQLFVFLCPQAALCKWDVGDTWVTLFDLIFFFFFALKIFRGWTYKYGSENTLSFSFYFLQHPLAVCCLLPPLRGYCICHLLCRAGREAAFVNIQESWHFPRLRNDVLWEVTRGEKCHGRVKCYVPETMAVSNDHLQRSPPRGRGSATQSPVFRLTREP